VADASDRPDAVDVVALVDDDEVGQLHHTTTCYVSPSVVPVAIAPGNVTG
jgi:hypothetical protein